MGGKYSDPKPFMSITYSLVTPVQILSFIIFCTINNIVTIVYFFICVVYVSLLFFVDPTLDCLNGLFPRGCSSKIKISYCRCSNGLLFVEQLMNFIRHFVK